MNVLLHYGSPVLIEDGPASKEEAIKVFIDGRLSFRLKAYESANRMLSRIEKADRQIRQAKRL